MCKVVLSDSRVIPDSMVVYTYEEVKERYSLMKKLENIGDNVLGYVSYSSFHPFFVPIIFDGCLMTKED